MKAERMHSRGWRGRAKKQGGKRVEPEGKKEGRESAGLEQGKTIYIASCVTAFGTYIED